MIRIKCKNPEEETILAVRENLIDFASFMGYDIKGYIEDIVPWRRSWDYRYFIVLSLPGVDYAKEIQGAFNKGEIHSPATQIKRYLLLNTHL